METSESVVEGFLAWAARTPDEQALVADGDILTYRALEHRSGRTARALADLGLGPESVIGVCLHRTVDLAVAVLGVLRAGAACLPLDPDDPPERLAAMLTDSDTAVLITDLAGDWPVPVLDTTADETLAAPVAIRRDMLLYVMHTSGSTGRPKAIAMPHGPQLDLLAWCASRYAEGARALHYYPFTTDVAMLDLLITWSSGGCLVLATEHERVDVDALTRLIADQRVSRVLLPVLTLHELARHAMAHPERVRTLREIITTGDRLTLTEPVRRMCESLPAVVLDDHYGATEVNVVTAPRLRPPAAAWPDRPHLGGPVSQARIHVLDTALDPVPVNVVGEIHVGGGALARGYLGRPDLTALSFVPDPFSDVPGSRLYRTGDLARWRPGGALELVGRADFQLSVRGHRVEPGEVEAALRTYPEVGGAVVVRSGEGAQAVLAAYVVPAGAARPDPAALRADLKARLPAHLVPAVVTVLPEFPTTTSGKVDRARLPEPDERVDLRQPLADDVERLVAAVWRDVLDVGEIGAHDNFFQLGGHSLLVTQVAFRVGAALDVDVPPDWLFDLPTVRQFADRLRIAGREEE
ncbi:amino acid adenylation domain-containing protein [Streptomyces anulatus]|uniref:non-ribosomal peptide synthetase n=1 Tax=Streptomyces anulatus TaxID=1892 RepID=UPI0036C0DA1A